MIMTEKRKQSTDSNLFQSIIQWYKKRREKKRREREKRKKNIVREYVEAILVALVAAMILRILVVQAFRIPTGSMKDTLLVGDFLLVNKFIYGVRTPDHIPLINIKIPHIRLPGFKDPKPGDIVVFKYPENIKLDYIKRCIAKGGQTVEMRNGFVYVDGKPEGKSEFVKRVYDSDPNEGVYVLHYKITKDNGKSYVIRYRENSHYVSNNLGPLRASNDHTVEMRQGQVFIDDKPGGKAELLNKAYQEGKGQYRLRYLITDENGDSFEINHYQKVQSLPTNYGPIWVPKKGATVKITPENYHLYQKIIEDYEKNTITWKEGKIFIDDKPLNEYTFKQNYFFMMGDNRDNSADSRSWGFLPRDHVVGQALIIYFSWDHSIPLYRFFKKVRWARIGGLIR